MWKKLAIGTMLVMGANSWGYAQSANLTGVVSDETGAELADVDINALNEGTGLARATRTDAAGSYVIALLPPGSYRVRAHKTGFRPVDHTSLVLPVDTTIRLDLRLLVGEVAETVEVAGGTPLLQQSPEIGTSVTSRDFERLPLVQIGRIRTPAAFVHLAPGVQGSIDINGGDSTAASNFVTVHGAPTFTNEFWVDGLPAGQYRQVGNFNEMAPSVDAVSEFRMQTSLLAAEYGNTGAGVTSIVLKSGTNAYRGSVYEFYRDSALDARNWLAVSKADVRQNEFGATLGGPVRLGRLYEGRDRTFFFVAYGGSRRRGLDIVRRGRIPTTSNRLGDFSDLRDNAGNVIPIYDPATTRVTAEGRVVRDPFAGNVIPGSRFDPIAARVIALLPDPNLVAAGLNYEALTGEQQLDPNTLTVKLDHALSAAHRLSSSLIHTRIPRLRLDTPLPAPLTNGIAQHIPSWTYRLSHTAILGTNLLANGYFGYNRFRNTIGPPVPQDDWPGQLGLSGVVGRGFPLLNFASGYSPLGSAAGIDNVDATYLAKGVVTWTRGQHSIKAGAEYRFNSLDDQSLGNTSGTFNFSNLSTGDPARPGTTGDPWASFLLGAVNTASASRGFDQRLRRSYVGTFLQDEWRIAPRLTLSLGLRWEFERPPYEVDDRYGLVDLSAPNPVAGGIPGAIVFAGDGPNGVGRRRLLDTDYSALGPRAGFAWRPHDAWSFKGGVGVYYTHNYVGVTSPGFSPIATYTTGDNGLTPAFLLRDGLPGGFATPSPQPGALNGQNGNVLHDSAAAMPRTVNWTLGLQRELPGRLLVEVNYVGARYTRQVATELSSLNQVDPSYLSLGTLLTRSVLSAEAAAAGIRVPYPGFTGTVAQALRPYPQYQRLTVQAAKVGESTYHSLELRASRRLNAGLTFQGSYTWSRSHGLTPSNVGNTAVYNLPQNALDLGAEHSLLPNDVPHSLVVSYTWELPLGRDRRWLTRGWLEPILGGWSIGAIHRYQSGYPLSVTANNTLPIFNLVLRPDQVAGQSPDSGIALGEFDPTVDRVVNLAAFSQPAPLQFGTSPPTSGDLRQFALLSENLSLTKRVALTNRVAFELYAHAFNVFNRHRFVDFDMNFNSTGFGRPRSSSLPRFVQLGIKLQF